MDLHDYEAERALAELIDKATSKRNDALDPELIHRIKRACKASEATLRLAFDLLFEYLKKPHSQVRLLTLEICAELFQRSSLFRSLLAAKFPRFLALVLGFRTNEPLPTPIEAATRLRQRALELIEEWQAMYGSRHPQVALGYSYIKVTLRYEFPQLDARREAAEASQRDQEARAQQLAQQRYHRLLDEWPSQSAESHSLLRQFAEAFTLLEQTNNPGIEDPTINGDEFNVDAEEIGAGVDWEDVGEVENDHGGVDEPHEGLAAYAAAEDDPLTTAPPIEDANSALDPVIEELYGVYKLICNQALPQVQEALRIVVRAEIGIPGEAQHRQRELLLRAATTLKSELAAAKERFEGAHLDLAALAHAQARRREDREATAAAVVENRKNEQIQQPLIPPNKPINPYDYIRDPAAPLGPSLTAAITSRKPRSTTPKAPTALPPIHQSTNTNTTSSSLPASVRASLASRAPVLPAGAFVRVWDSGTTAIPQYVTGGNALEVSNHWGPVDVHQELPRERIEELFLYAPTAEQQQQRTTGNASTSNVQAAGTNNNIDNNRVMAGRTPSRSGVPSSSRNNLEISAQPQPVPNVLSLASGAATTAEGRRLQRAAERAYNDAVISAAAMGNGSDEALARALEGGGAGTNDNDKKRASKKRKGTSKERLQKKLLGGRAQAAALADAEAAESSRRRENFSNTW